MGTRFERRSTKSYAMGVLAVCALLVLHPLSGAFQSRVLYRCLISGELLQSCCRQLENGIAEAEPEADCCRCDGEESPVDVVALDEASGACGCCETILLDGTAPLLATVTVDAPVTGLFWRPHLTLPTSAAVVGLLSSATVPRAHAPPEPPAYLLYGAFRS